ncbi:hypothetical protein D3C81_1531230 [compost metagenome]
MKMLRHRFIRRQHEFLNNLFRDRTFALHDVDRLAVLVDDHLRFLEIEVDRAAPHAVPPQLQGQLLHQLERLDQIGVTFGYLRIFFLQNFPHIGVGHPFLGANHAREDIVLHDLHLLVEFHLAGQREAVYLRIQGANPVRQPVRQHRNDAIHQIHAAAAVISFLIELGILPHVIPDIGDMHAQSDIPVRQALHIHGVVQVLRVLAVDRDDHLVA